MLRTKTPIYLASQSPRRKSLLKQIGLNFKTINVELEEEILDGEHPIKTVKRLSKEKLQLAEGKISAGIIITADTIVVIDGDIIGKPLTINHAKKILKRLSGKTHFVYTGYSIKNINKDIMLTSYSRTAVTFRELSNSEINDYVKTGNQTIPILGINTPAGFFTLPEFSTYLNQDNISLKGNFAFIPKDHFVKHLSLSLEKGVIGQCSQTEFGLSVSSSIGNFSGLTKIILGSDKKAGITQKINLKVGKNSYLFGEATYDTGTMDGQRKCYSASGDSCIQAEVGVEYRFNLR